MPVDVVGAVVGWVLSLMGDAGKRLVHRAKDQRTLREALRLAVDKVVEQADSSCREALREGLGEVFSTAPRVRLDASASVAEAWRAAIAAQMSQLDQMVHGDNGQPFYQVVSVDRKWLVEQVTAAVSTALHHVVAARGPEQLVDELHNAEVLDRLDDLPAPAAVARRTLPRDIGSFTGRADELGRLMQAVTDRAATGGVVEIHAIEGMVGIGKTAFAVHAAHQLAAQFPDGQIYLELHAHTPGQRPVDPVEALATLLLSIGVAPAQIPADAPARELLWRDRLAGKKVLLVLDDATGPAQVSPLLPGTAQSLVMITSRRRLALDDAVSISLDILTPEEAAALLLGVANRPDLQPTDAGIAKVTRLCGYLPLAIRLVAEQLHRRSSTVADVAAELAAAGDRLDAIDAGERSIAAAFDLSYRDLTADQRQLFRRLGLQPGVEIDAYAAAALGETTVATARHHLADLDDLHLLDEPVRGRYRLHDLLREYARRLAADDPPAERAEALDRLLDYYLHTATLAAVHLTTRTPTTGPPVAHPPSSVPELATGEDAIGWLETERANLYAAIDYAALHARHSHAISLPAAMHEFLRAQGPWGQALTLHHTGLKAARGTGRRLGEATALTNLGRVQYLTGDYPAATENLEQALALYRKLANGLGEATALTYLGSVQYLTGNYRAAIASQERALELHRELGNQLGEATALTYLGRVQCPTGDYQAATENLEQALALHRKLRNRLGEANALTYLGRVQYLTGDYPAATASQQQALELYRKLRNRLGEANALTNLGRVQHSTRDYPAATAGLEQALELHRDLGNRVGEANALTNLGSVQHSTRDYPAATASLEQALELHRDLGNRVGEANALNNLGQVLRARGAVADARAHHRHALDIAQALGTPREQARALEGIGHCHLHQGRVSEGGAYLRQALTLYRRLGSPDASRVEKTLPTQDIPGSNKDGPEKQRPATTRLPTPRHPPDLTTGPAEADPSRRGPATPTSDTVLPP